MGIKIKCIYWSWCILLFSLGSTRIIYAQIQLTNQDLIVLDRPSNTMMKDYLTSIVQQQFQFRDSILNNIVVKEDWQYRVSEIRDSIISWTGPLPKKTPLKAITTGIIEKEDYFIEKVLFESRPNFYVSANLYVPKGIEKPMPAQLNVIGHAQNGKANERYQRMSIAQVKAGFVVLTMDQIGQGERGLLSLHKTLGNQAFLAGTHLFNIMVWDVIRAIDYLVSRPEVDSERMSMTGSSGGGMMTTYILPFEDRISVAVPTCNPNTWRHRVEANLGTDHEQVFFGAFQRGIDPRGDPLFTHIPNPLMLNTTLEDHLNPTEGVWNLHTYLYKAYAAFNVPEKLAISMVNAGHDYNKEQRELTYAWIRRWSGIDHNFIEPSNMDLLSESSLWASKTGNVFDNEFSIKPIEIIRKFYSDSGYTYAEIDSKQKLDQQVKKINRLVRKVLFKYDELNRQTEKVELIPQMSKEFEINHFILEPEKGIQLPGVLIDPMHIKHSRKVVLYLHDGGKKTILKELDIINNLLQQGLSICAIDLRGLGETGPDFSNKFWDFLAGKPIFSQRVKDILYIVDWLKGSQINAKDIKIWANGICSLYSSFAGVLSPSISSFVLENPLISFASLLATEKPQYQNEVLLPGVLTHFDMTQIYQSLSPRSVKILNPLDGEKEKLQDEDIQKFSQAVETIYKGYKGSKLFTIKNIPTLDRNPLIIEYLR